MSRSKFRQTPLLEGLETRELMSAGGPTAQQQYMLELINEARLNPRAAAERVTTNLTPDVQATVNYFQVDLEATRREIAESPTRPPLAWNPALTVSAQRHSQDMATNRTQSHTGSDGSSIDSRIQDAGYTNASTTAENAFAYARSVDEAMQAFLVDWGVADQGHRRNILQPQVARQDSFRDVGIGIVKSNDAKFGPLVVTQNFGTRPNSQAILLGVAYRDNNPDRFYNPGEGEPEVRIDATNLETKSTTTTTTMDAGGYQVSLPAGRYQITASVGDTVVKTVELTIGTENVKQDFILSDPWDGRSRNQFLSAITRPGPSAKPALSASPTGSSPSVRQSTPPSPTTTTASARLGAWTSWKARVS
jgi:uncharacterized protein YkwD